jgi:hypothetical protein
LWLALLGLGLQGNLRCWDLPRQLLLARWWWLQALHCLQHLLQLRLRLCWEQLGPVLPPLQQLLQLL